MVHPTRSQLLTGEMPRPPLEGMKMLDRLTPLGEKTPRVPPSSLMDTPISASSVSLTETLISSQLLVPDQIKPEVEVVVLPLQTDGFGLPQLLLPRLVQLSDDLLCFLQHKPGIFSSGVKTSSSRSSVCLLSHHQPLSRFFFTDGLRGDRLLLLSVLAAVLDRAVGVGSRRVSCRSSVALCWRETCMTNTIIHQVKSNMRPTEGQTDGKSPAGAGSSLAATPLAVGVSCRGGGPTPETPPRLLLLLTGREREDRAQVSPLTGRNVNHPAYIREQHVTHTQSHTHTAAVV